MQIFEKVSIEFEGAYSNHLTWAVAQCITCCKDPDSRVQYSALGALVNLIRGEDHKVGNTIVVKAVNLIAQVATSALAKGNTEVVERSLQGIEELSQDMFDNFKSCIEPAIKMCLWIATHESAADDLDIQSAAMTLVHSLIENYKGPVRRSNQLPNIINTCVKVMVVRACRPSTQLRPRTTPLNAKLCVCVCVRPCLSG